MHVIFCFFPFGIICIELENQTRRQQELADVDIQLKCSVTSFISKSFTHILQMKFICLNMNDEFSILSPFYDINRLLPGDIDSSFSEEYISMNRMKTRKYKLSKCFNICNIQISIKMLLKELINDLINLY